MQSNEFLMKQFLKKIYPNDPCPCGTETDFGRVVGDELIPLFTFAIRLITDTEIRIDRLKARESKILVTELCRAAICIHIIWSSSTGQEDTIPAVLICEAGQNMMSGRNC